MKISELEKRLISHSEFIKNNMKLPKETENMGIVSEHRFSLRKKQKNLIKNFLIKKS